MPGALYYGDPGGEHSVEVFPDNPDRDKVISYDGDVLADRIQD